MSEAHQIILSLSKLYGERCFVCHKPCTKGKGFTIHHKKYIKNDVIYKNYTDRNKYYIALEKMVRKDQKRFLLVCNTHHQSIERLKRFSPKTFNRLIKAVRMSK